MTSNFTTSLHLIVKDEVEAVAELVKQAHWYFDAIYITISGKKAYDAFKKLDLDEAPQIDYRPWNNRFDDARNHNWKLGEGHDFSMWIDSDDEFNFSAMPQLKEVMQDTDAVYLPYHYDHDEQGNVIVSHWRERIVRRSIGWNWKGWVHETLIPDQPIRKEMVDFAPVIHHSDHREQSLNRNHDILVQAYEETEDPRYLHYLAISHYTQKNYDLAINLFKQYIEVGGWDEEIYRSLVKISECYYAKKDYDNAIRHGLEAIGFMPELPMAYHAVAQYEFKQKNYKQALEWVKVAVQKKAPENMSIYDPTQANRSLLTGALCEYELGNYREAVELVKKVTVVDVSELLPEFEKEASIERLRDILPALFKHYKDPKVLWESLHDSIKYDSRFRAYREQFTEPETWSKGSIVFFCGKGYEEWGAHTLANGMGGSEEAVVYLSRELVKRGYRVTVFGEVPEAYDDWVDKKKNQAVSYRPWQHIDRRDTFDTMIVWRAPQFAGQFKANKILIDMHDKLPEGMVKPFKNATYMFKSQYHASLYPQITNYSVVGNGIDGSQFKNEVSKKVGSVGYFSAYYRGLECLLDMWGEIRKEVPKATLDVYYGWQSWVGAEGEDDFYQRMCKKLDDLKDQGVTEHGRVDHEQLAKAMQETQVWAYPTEFEEIYAITATKAREAQCQSVYTGVAALKETARGIEIPSEHIYTDPEAQKAFINTVVKELKDPSKLKAKVPNRYWKDVAKQWSSIIEA